jgi:hypothetical protein
LDIITRNDYISIIYKLLMAQTLKFGNKVWAAKEESVLAYNDINNNYKPLPFFFKRTSIGTRVNKDGLIETMGQDIARIDYTDSADGVLLLEPSSTNLFEYSEDFSVSYWLKLGVGSASAPIVTADYATSPDGTQNATRVQFDAVGNSNADRSGLVRTFAFTTGQTYSISCWVKSTNGTSQVIQFRIAGAQTSEEQTATSEWKLYTATFTATVSTTDQFGMQIRGINSVNESDILIYGMQLELLDYPTSYIPTSGSTVTRAAEVCNNSGNSEVFNDSEGVLFADIRKQENGGSTQVISLSDGSTNNNVYLSLPSTPNVINVEVLASGSQANLSSASTNQSNQNKFAIKYKQNDFVLWINGFEVDTDNSGNTPVGLNKINFDFGQGSFDFYGKTKEIGYYDTALTDLELETLTSYRNWVSMVNELNLNIIYNG